MILILNLVYTHSTIPINFPTYKREIMLTYYQGKSAKL